MFTSLYILLLFHNFGLFLISNVALFVTRNGRTQLIDKNEYSFYNKMLILSFMFTLITLQFKIA